MIFIQKPTSRKSVLQEGPDSLQRMVYNAY